MSRRMPLLLVCFVVLYAVLVKHGFRPASLEVDKPSVLLPLVPSLLLAAGDRHLAANISYIQAVTLPTLSFNLLDDRENFQNNSVVFNPKHEDNYYLAAASYPWEGRVDIAQRILLSAAKARYWDSMPYFLLGLNAANHMAAPLVAATYLNKAAEIERGPNKAFFTKVAAYLETKDNDLQYLLAHTQMLADGSASPRIKYLMLQRVARVKILIDLRAVSEHYQGKFGEPLQRLSQLVGAGLMDVLPNDPIGLGFGVDKNGVPQFLEKLDVRD